MTPVIVLAAIVLVPVVLLMVLRINAALVFLSLCLGNVLVQFVAGDSNSFFSLLSSSHVTNPAHRLQATNDTISLVLLLLPVVLTAIFMVRTIRGRGRLLLNALPSAGVGLLGALLIVPLLPSGLSHDVVGSSLWDQVQRAQDLIVGTSALVCLFVLWLQRPKTGGENKHSKHQKG
jgi:hypothetical protein